MVDRDRSLVQLEVRIVGVRLIDSASVLAGNELGRIAHMLCTIIAGPVVNDILCCGRASGRSRSRSARSLDRFGCGSNRNALISAAVGSDRIVDRYVSLFPNREEIFIGLLFVSCNMRSSGTGRRRVARTGPDEEVSGRAALGLGPALEGIAFTGLCTKDFNSLVDLDAGVGMIERTLAVILAAVVAVPVDVRRGLFFLILIDSHQLDGVGIMVALINGAGRNDCTCFILNFCIGLQCREQCAGHQLSRCILIRRAVPGLQHPVVKDLVLGGGRGCAGAYARVVLVKCRVTGRVAAAIRIVEDADTVSTDGLCTPLGVQVELLGDPETIDVRVVRGTIAPLVHGIREVCGLVIG